MWDSHQISPLLGPASLLAHCLVSTLFGKQPTRCSNNDPGPPRADIVLFRFARKDFHTLMFYSPPQPMCDITIHPLQSSPLASTRFFLQSMWDPIKSIPFGASVLTGKGHGTLPRVLNPPPWGTVSLLARDMARCLVYYPS